MENQADLYKTTITDTIDDFQSLMAKDLGNIKKLISIMEADPSRMPSLTTNLSQLAASLQENTNAMRALQNVALYVDREAKYR
jgi:hypothetical protein